MDEGKRRGRKERSKREWEERGGREGTRWMIRFASVPVSAHLGVRCARNKRQEEGKHEKKKEMIYVPKGVVHDEMRRGQKRLLTQ